MRAIHLNENMALTDQDVSTEQAIICDVIDGMSHPHAAQHMCNIMLVLRSLTGPNILHECLQRQLSLEGAAKTKQDTTNSTSIQMCQLDSNKTRPESINCICKMPAKCAKPTCTCVKARMAISAGVHALHGRLVHVPVGT